MATQKGIWNLQQVRDKQLQDLWTSKNGTVWFTGRTEKGVGSTSAVPTAQISSPVQLTGDWTKLYTSGSSAESHTVAAAKGTGTLYTWGTNQYGQAGVNLQAPGNQGLSSPVQVPGTTWSTVGNGSQWKLASKTDNTLYAWGLNIVGTLGQNNTTNYSSPVQIPGTTWKTSYGELSAGLNEAYAIKTDGTLWGWGSNSYAGALGQNNRTAYSSPKQIPGTTWSKLSANNHHRFAAIKTDGTLWGCGYNVVGVFGLNDRVHRSSPVQIFGTQTNWAQVSQGNNQIGAINTDGELWVTGNNTQGVLGKNNLTQYSSPVQIPGTTWSQEPGALKFAGSNAGCLKTDGTLWLWGYMGIGQEAQNTTAITAYSSPVQVGAGMDWSTNNYNSWWSTDSGNFILTMITP